MAPYRIYILTPQERVDEAREGVFPNDKAALAEAAQMRRNAFAAEVWAGDRLVGRIGHEFRL
jgi:hypothetical protein